MSASAARWTGNATGPESMSGPASCRKRSKPNRLLAAAPAPQVDVEADGGEVAPEGAEERLVDVGAGAFQLFGDGDLRERDPRGGGDAEVVRQEHLGLSLARDRPLRDVLGLEPRGGPFQVAF